MISEDRINYNNIRKKYFYLATAAAEKFQKDFSKNFKNMDEIHEKMESFFMKELGFIVSKAVADCVAKKVYIDEKAFFDEYLTPYITWDEDFSKVHDPYMQIVLKSKDLDDYRIARREGRGQIIGGGFGLGGALKGMAQAGAINMAAGAAHKLVILN